MIAGAPYCGGGISGSFHNFQLTSQHHFFSFKTISHIHWTNNYNLVEEPFLIELYCAMFERKRAEIVKNKAFDQNPPLILVADLSPPGCLFQDEEVQKYLCLAICIKLSFLYALQSLRWSKFLIAPSEEGILLRKFEFWSRSKLTRKFILNLPRVKYGSVHPAVLFIIKSFMLFWLLILVLRRHFQAETFIISKTESSWHLMEDVHGTLPQFFAVDATSI